MMFDSSSKALKRTGMFSTNMRSRCSLAATASNADCTALAKTSVRLAAPSFARIRSQ